MVQSAWPFNDQAIDETQFSKWATRFQVTGVDLRGNVGGATPLAVTPGAGMRVNVAPGTAFIRGYSYESTTVVSLDIEPSTTQARRDLVVLRLDPLTNSAALAIVKGTPGSLSDPATTRTVAGIYELPLYRLAIPASSTSILAANVQDLRRWTEMSSGYWSTATRPGTVPGETVQNGVFGFNYSLGRHEYWDGDSWEAMIRTGTLSVALGGTGGETAAEARTNLGIRADTLPTNGVNRVDQNITGFPYTLQSDLDYIGDKLPANDRTAVGQVGNNLSFEWANNRLHVHIDATTYIVRLEGLN